MAGPDGSATLWGISLIRAIRSGIQYTYTAKH